MVDWQPIDTAPKDGSKILAWFPADAAYDILHWYDDGWYMQDDYPLDDADIQPTHWAQLSPPA